MDGWKKRNYFDTIIKTKRWLSDRFFDLVDRLPKDDFDALIHAINRRLNSWNPELSRGNVEKLKQIKQEIANSINLTDEQKINCIRIVNAKLGVGD